MKAKLLFLVNSIWSETMIRQMTCYIRIGKKISTNFWNFGHLFSNKKLLSLSVKVKNKNQTAEQINRFFVELNTLLFVQNEIKQIKFPVIINFLIFKDQGIKNKKLICLLYCCRLGKTQWFKWIKSIKWIIIYMFI